METNNNINILNDIRKLVTIMFKCFLPVKEVDNEDILEISEFIGLVFIKGGRQVRGRRQATHCYLSPEWNCLYLVKCSWRIRYNNN